MTDIERIGMVNSPRFRDKQYQVGLIEFGEDWLENGKNVNPSGTIWIETEVSWSQVGKIANLNLPKPNKINKALSIAREVLNEREYEFKNIFKQYPI